MTTPLCEQQTRHSTLQRFVPWAALGSVAMAVLMTGCAQQPVATSATNTSVSYTHLRAHET